MEFVWLYILREQCPLQSCYEIVLYPGSTIFWCDPHLLIYQQMNLHLYRHCRYISLASNLHSSHCFPKSTCFHHILPFQKGNNYNTGCFAAFTQVSLHHYIAHFYFDIFNLVCLISVPALIWPACGLLLVASFSCSSFHSNLFFYQ